MTARQKRSRPGSAQTALRLPSDLLERADALVERVAADPERAGTGMVTRSDVLRLALVRGLTTLERKYETS